jgi:EpsI family protein
MMIPRYRFYLVYVLLITAAFFVHTHGNLAVPTSLPLTEIPLHHGGWSMAGETRFSEQVMKILRPSNYLYRVYRDGDGRRVALYLGYHDGGPQSGAIHSPKHCLPGGGWFELSERKMTLPVGEKTVRLVCSVYQNGGAKEMFLYWFQVKGKTLSDEYRLKLEVVANSILNGRRDSAFVRVSIPFEADEEAAFATGRRFIEEFYPQIEAVLPM